MVNTLNCSEWIKNYIEYMGSEFVVLPYKTDGCQIITPFWHQDGTHIEVFVLPNSDGNTQLSDEGQTIDWLFSSGIDVMSSETRQAQVTSLAKRAGLVYRTGELTVDVTSENIGESLHVFVSTIQSVGEMIQSRQQRGKYNFKEDVELYLAQHDQDYRSNYKIQGRSTEHSIDFYLNSSRNYLVEALSATTKSTAHKHAVFTAFKWQDIRERGWKQYTMITVLDDSEDKWEDVWRSEKVRRPLEEYSDRIIRWSTERVQLLRVETNE